MNNVLITGATGFIGSNLAQKLSSIGYNVYRLSRNINTDLKKGVIEYSDQKGICERITEVNFEIVIHLATFFLGNHKHTQIGPLIDSNIKLGTRLIDFSVNNGVEKFINVSTYAQSTDGLNYNPQNLYAATKEVFLDILKYYSNEHEIQVINLEMFDSYGPWDTRGKFFNLASEAIYNGRKFPMSAGKQILCLLHIDDIVDAFQVVLSQKFSETKVLKHFTLLNEETLISLEDLIKKMKILFNSDSVIEFGHYEYRKNEIFVPNSRYDKLPNWNPRIGIEKGIRLMYTHLLNTRNIHGQKK